MTISTPTTLNAQSIQTWFIQQMAEQLEIEAAEIEPSDTFESYGLDSAQAMLIASRAEKMLGFQLAPSLLFRYPTIAGLSGRLAEEVQLLEAELLNTSDRDALAQALAEVEKLSPTEAQNLLNS
jgi:acyl carrier protein